MEIHLPAEQEARLSRVAHHEGKPVEQLLVESAASLLREHDRFLEAVEQGIAQADRGELIEDEQVRMWLEGRERS